MHPSPKFTLARGLVATLVAVASFALVGLANVASADTTSPSTTVQTVAVPTSGSAQHHVVLPLHATHVGLHWRGPSGVLPSILLSGAWTSIPVDDTLDSGVNTSAVIPVNGTDSIDLITPAGISDVEVTAINASAGPSTSSGSRVSAAVVRPPQNTGMPISYAAAPSSIITRSQWGADESLRKGTPEFAYVNKIIVHHTDTPNGDGNPAATVRAILAFHTQGNGWNDIGYNYLIDESGRIYEGRYARDYGGAIPTADNGTGGGVIGAHTENYNTGSIGIALLGTFTSQAPTPAAQASLDRLIAWQADRWGVDPSQIFGHRDFNQTSCPGQVAYNMLPTFRAQVANIINSEHPPMISIGATSTDHGYWMADTLGDVFSFGDATDHGSTAGVALRGPIVGMASTPSGNGYWLVASDGGVFPFGDAGGYGSAGSINLRKPIVGMAPTPSGHGYWLVAADGGIFPYGDAVGYGSAAPLPLRAPIVGMTSTPSGNGYWLVASDGGMFPFGSAGGWGSAAPIPLRKPIVGMSATITGRGYWLVAADGGIFPFGDAGGYGSAGNLQLRKPVTGMVRTSNGQGYWMVAADGGIFTYGNAGGYGSGA